MRSYFCPARYSLVQENRWHFIPTARLPCSRPGSAGGVCFHLHAVLRDAQPQTQTLQGQVPTWCMSGEVYILQLNLAVGSRRDRALRNSVAQANVTHGPDHKCHGGSPEPCSPSHSYVNTGKLALDVFYFIWNFTQLYAYKCLY